MSTLPRINSRTPLQQPILPTHDQPRSAIPMSLPVSQLLAAFQPRKPKPRATFLALLGLALLSAFVCFGLTSLSPSIGPHNAAPSGGKVALVLDSIPNGRKAKSGIGHTSHLSRPHTHNPPRVQVKLDQAEELAAVSSFIASLPHNVIPPQVDPTIPLDPQLVLDFDTQGPRAKEEVQAMVEEVWNRNPVFLYSKVRRVALCRYTPLKKLINSTILLHPAK